MTVRACLRISVDTQTSQSIDQQKHLITRWAEYKRPGERIEFYIDPGVSGSKPLAERPEGSRLLADLGAGDTLAVTKIDRLARNVQDLLATLQHCEEAGAKFVATEQDVSTEGPYGRFMLTLLGALAELERGIVGERVKAARAQFLRDGRHGVGRLPYGFRAVIDEEHGWLVVRPDPEEGPKLREAVLAVINGATQASQGEKLGLPEPTFRGLLTNPRLYGQTPGGKLDKDAGIITMAEWRQLQERIGGPRSWSRAPGYGQAMRCYHCDSRMYYDTHNDYYRCESKHAGRPTIKRAIADEYAESYFLEHFCPIPVVEVTVHDDRTERLAEVEIALEEATDRLRGDVDDDAVMAEVLELKQLRKQILAEPAGDKVTYRDTGQTYGERWQEADDERRAAMLAQAIKVVVHPANRPEGRMDVHELVSDAESGSVAFRYTETG